MFVRKCMYKYPDIHTLCIVCHCCVYFEWIENIFVGKRDMDREREWVCQRSSIHNLWAFKWLVVVALSQHSHFRALTFEKLFSLNFLFFKFIMSNCLIYHHHRRTSKLSMVCLKWVENYMRWIFKSRYEFCDVSCAEWIPKLTT